MTAAGSPEHGYAPHIDHPTPHRPGYKYEVHAVPGFGMTEFEYLDFDNPPNRTENGTVGPLVKPEPQLEEAHAVAMSVQAAVTAAERIHAEWPSAMTDSAWYVRRNQ